MTVWKVRRVSATYDGHNHGSAVGFLACALVLTGERLMRGTAAARVPVGFHHEALLYDGEAEFVRTTEAFLRAGLEADAAVMAVVSGHKADLLREALAEDAQAVAFADMAQVGANPAWILPVWQGFVTQHTGRGRAVRGIGEPVTDARSAAELVECQHHESLLNVAFEGQDRFTLRCPYDRTTLPPAVVDEVYRSHPLVLAGGAYAHSGSYHDVHAPLAPEDAPLPEPASPPAALHFGPVMLSDLRQFVGRWAHTLGLDTPRAQDLVLAVNEVATNSLLYGHGRGSVRIWREDRAVVCEVRDDGRVTEPLAGRRLPSLDSGGGRGLWLVNQLCDLTQLRASAHGTVVRLHLRCP